MIIACRVNNTISYYMYSVIVDNDEKVEGGETSRSGPLDEQDPQSSKSTTPTECCALLPDTKDGESAPRQNTKLSRSVRSSQVSYIYTVCDQAINLLLYLLNYKRLHSLIDKRLQLNTVLADTLLTNICLLKVSFVLLI